jgi:hypothetical protein
MRRLRYSEFGVICEPAKVHPSAALDDLKLKTDN